MLTIDTMPAHLEGLSTAILGRKLVIPSDKPLVIKIATTSRERGKVLITHSAGRFQLANDSAVASAINGTPVRQGELRDGDEVLIGKDRFRLAVHGDDGHDDEHDRLGTQKVAPVIAQAERPAGACAVCDANIAVGAAGWSDGERSICTRCIATGVKPEHLPNPPAPAPAPVPHAVTVETPPTLLVPVLPAVAAPLSAEHTIETPSDLLVVPPAPAREATPLGDRILSGAGDVTPLANRRLDPSAGSRAGEVPSSDSDRMRNSRRISASRLTAVEPAGSGREGLLSKVGRVFGRRDERYKRLEELQAERLGRLAEAGRLALGPGLGLGLGEALVATLLQGGSIALSAADCSTIGLEQWRALRQRLDLLDAEIAALRRLLGLGPDPESTLQQSPTLRVDGKRQQERAFAALDGLSTDEIGPTLAADAPAPRASPPSSGRLRPGRRRR